MRSHLLALALMIPMATLVAQETPMAPVISFHLGWSPKGTCAKPKGQRIHIASIKVDGQMEERGHWRKYYFNALNELPSCREELQKVFAVLLTAKGFTVVDDPEVPTYEAVIYISEADTSGSFFSGMGEARPLSEGQAWLFKPKSIEMMAACAAKWNRNRSISEDASLEMLGQGIHDMVKVKRTQKIEPKIKTSFAGITGKDLMANPVFVENATRCTEGAIKDILDFYMAKMDDEKVDDIIRKLRTR